MLAEDALRGAVERGRAGEAIAALFLRLAGFDLLDRNRRARGGEIDLVARDDRCLVFVEVRLRRGGAGSRAAATITRSKGRRLRSAAAGLLATREDLVWPGRTVRFDVVTLDLEPGGLVVEHLRGVRL